jgi:hypothetical protein
MRPYTDIIHVESFAPAKPVLGTPCNCLWRLLVGGAMSVEHTFISQKGGGLQWGTPQRKYQCGAVVAPRIAVIVAAACKYSLGYPCFCMGFGTVVQALDCSGHKLRQHPRGSAQPEHAATLIIGHNAASATPICI